MTDLLYSDGLDVHYGRVQVLYDVSIAVQAGEMVALLGTNGAGKTTLFDCISGFRRPDKGRIVFDSKVNLVSQPAHERIVLGIGRLFQQAKLFPSVTVRDVIRTAQPRREPRPGGGPNRRTPSMAAGNTSLSDAADICAQWPTS